MEEAAEAKRTLTQLCLISSVQVICPTRVEVTAAVAVDADLLREDLLLVQSCPKGRS